jgi:hypothetical protein
MRRALAALALFTALAGAAGAACDLGTKTSTQPAIGTYTPMRFLIDLGGGAVVSEPGAAVTAAFFRDAKVSPMLGRVFVDPDQPRSVVVISHGLWTQRFEANPAIVGKEMVIDERRMTVVGVMPQSFQFPEGARLWVRR